MLRAGRTGKGYASVFHWLCNCANQSELHKHNGYMGVGELRELFKKQFGAEPEVISSAPGRVNIIGEHTDYNGGQVLPIAIDRRTWFAARRAAARATSRVRSSTDAAQGELDAGSPRRSGRWWDYIAGVCDKLSAGDSPIPQFDALVVSDVPAGAGLSSSAALEVATAIGLSRLAGRDLDMKALALAAWRAETEFVGVACGVMDQFASALCESSRALHLWCDTLASESVPMSESVLIFDTVTSRSLRGSAFNDRRAECEQALQLLRQRYPDLPNLAAATPSQVEDAGLPTLLKRRALHVTEENGRVEEVVRSLESSGRIPGRLLYESHLSLRDQYECSTPQLDWFVERMRGLRGISGARLTGAGWGGCAIAVGEREALGAVGDEVAAGYQHQFGVQPRIWLTGAGEGARLESV